MRRIRLGHRVAPFAAIQVHCRPLGVSQPAGSYKDQRRKVQRTANRQPSFVAVDNAHQRTHALGIGYGGKVLGLDRGRSPVGSRLARPVAMA
jgi:hypothetical protein